MDPPFDEECGSFEELGFQLTMLPGLIHDYINDHKKEDATTCNAFNTESAHKAIVTLHLVSHFLMNTSTTNPALSNYSTYYGNITDDLQSLLCLMTCTSGGPNSIHFPTFVLDLKMGEGKDLFQKGDGFFHRRDIDETAFSMYQCPFLKRANEIISNLMNNYQTCSSL